MQAPPHNRQSGFTLIEVMIAIMIMAIISLIAWRGLDIMTRANTQMEVRGEENARLMRTLQQLEHDLAWRTTIELPSSAMDMPEQGAEPTPPEPTEDRQVPPISMLPVGMDVRRLNQIPLQLELVRAAPAAPGQWQRVRWWLQSGTLYRAAGQPTNSYPLPDPKTADSVAVLEGIASFNVRAWEPQQGWRQLPTTSRSLAPASGLEIRLGTRRSAGPVSYYRRVLAFD
ncbi:general secretion pathway protein J [Halopseudomonas litoralis]|uniref:General secretion pathway protein J n=1 Tax=Halopseudomonas litoralis TaxID=797277 RepID=A0A1H1Q621_9GAMM|nr:prepilin-type N-terminal cleavage/methylation domain-containing protein [Halopseudomonas litoralis]SDS18763.1 general secretion pathway protein J [Halopseudomonas litoralis]